MVDKITLTNLVNLQNENTAVAAINANNAKIVTAIDNTLSRDGTSPNTMGSSLDMNSNRIINLPSPISATEPVPFGEFNAAVIGKGNVPTGGTPSQVLVKKTSADYDTQWVNESANLAAGNNISISGAPATISVLNTPSFTNVLYKGTTGTTTVQASSAASGTLTLPAATDTLVGQSTADTLSNKTLVAPALGTPASGTLTNATGLPISTGVSGLAAGVAAFLGTPTSANLATAVTNETGTGSLVFATTPTLVTPVLGAATATTINGTAITTGTGTLTLNSNTLALNGPNAVVTFIPPGSVTTNYTLPTTSATLARTDAAQTFTGNNSFNGNTSQVGTLAVSVVSTAALAAGANGGVNPAFNVDTSTTSQVSGLNVKGAVTGGTVAVSVIDSGANANLDIAAKGTGTINIAQNSSGAVNLGNVSPTINIGQSGTATLNVGKSSAASGTIVLAGTSGGAVTLAPTAVASGTLTFPNGADTLTANAATQTLTNKTLTSPAVSNPNVTGTMIYGGVTLNAAVTGTGNMVLSSSPTLVTPALGTPSAVVLTNGTGLPLSGHTTQAANTIVANATGSAAAPTAIDISTLTSKASPAATDIVMISDQAASGALKRVTVSSLASAGSVSSIAGNTGAFTLGTGLTNSVNDIRVSLPSLTNSLGADVALSNTASYFDGPSVAQGVSGTWLATGNVVLQDTAGAAQFNAKLWDGTTVIASNTVTGDIASRKVQLSLSGIITSPAGNIRISVNDTSSTSGKILFNSTGLSKDSTVTAVRIA